MVRIFDILKPAYYALSNPQTTISAIIGSQLMHNFERNSPLCTPIARGKKKQGFSLFTTKHLQDLDSK